MGVVVVRHEGRAKISARGSSAYGHNQLNVRCLDVNTNL